VRATQAKHKRLLQVSDSHPSPAHGNRLYTSFQRVPSLLPGDSVRQHIVNGLSWPGTVLFVCRQVAPPSRPPPFRECTQARLLHDSGCAFNLGLDSSSFSWLCLPALGPTLICFSCLYQCPNNRFKNCLGEIESNESKI
jgi:hypothetical protein